MNDALLALLHPSVTGRLLVCEKFKGCEAAFEAAESQEHHEHQVTGLPGTAVSEAMALTGDDCCEK